MKRKLPTMLRFSTYYFLLFVLLVSLPIHSLYAGNAFKPGYYISTSGDSLQGYVKFGNRIANETYCLFKSDKKSPAEKFLPSDIKRYGVVGGKSFISRMFPEDSVEDSFKGPIFMEILQEGRLGLFRYQDRFFLEYEEGTKFKELISSSVVKNIGYRVYREPKNEYIDILVDAMEDCPSVSLPIKKGHRRVELVEGELMKLMGEYHACLKESLVQPDIRPGMRIIVGSTIGGGETQISYRPAAEFQTLVPSTNSVIYSIVNTDYKESRSAMFGFFTNISFPRGYSGLSFHTEFLYQPLRFVGVKQFSVARSSFNDPHDIMDELEIRLHKIIIPIGLRKTFGTGPRPFYLGGGISLHLNVGRNYIVYRDRFFQDTGAQLLSTERPWAANNVEPGLWAHAGMVISNTGDSQLSVEFRVEQSGARNRLNVWGQPGGENRYLLRSAFIRLSYGFWARGSASRLASQRSLYSSH